MDIISKFARPLGIAMAAIGIAMVAVSGYYLYAYMRSGSDVEAFDVDAAAPEDMLALLGQSLPEPVSYEPAKSRPSDVSAQEEIGAEGSNGEVVVAEGETLMEDVTGVETVSIASFVPGAVLVSDDASDLPAVVEPKANVGADVTTEQPVSAIAQDAAVDVEGADQVVPEPSVSTEVMLDTFTSIYPGGNMNPRYWPEPYWAGNLPFGGPTIPDGFVPVDASDVVHASTSGERALRMRIPSIDLEASVSELELRDLGDSRAWSTPDKVVGHIPTTARPGELANGWYFGHLDDFLSNEGAIFRRLPEISEMIRNEPVDIFLATDEAEYLYRVTGTQQVHRDELFLAESDNAQISLVTCWPFRVYDHRIVVSAVLIAVKSLNEA